LQEDLYKGRLGLKSTKDMRYLDSLLLNQECKLETDDCENIKENLENGKTNMPTNI